MVFDKPIVIEKLDENTEEWSEYIRLHARINKTKQSEYLSAGATRSAMTLTFTLRYAKPLEDIAMNTQIYRIVYKGFPYNVVDYDDYMLMHQTIKLVGESY